MIRELFPPESVPQVKGNWEGEAELGDEDEGGAEMHRAHLRQEGGEVTWKIAAIRWVENKHTFMVRVSLTNDIVWAGVPGRKSDPIPTIER